MTKPKILFLVHRIPFPPNKGDKIRSFNILKALSTKYQVYLGCFLDDLEDLVHVSALDQWCVKTYVETQNKHLSKISGLTGFLTNQAITLPYYSSSHMQKWVNDTLTNNDIDRCLVFSSAMAQFVDQHDHIFSKTVIDFVDVDSDKWDQYASNKSGIKKWFYQREARLLKKFEMQTAERSAFSTFVSDEEAALFRHYLSDTQGQKVRGIRNGVDTAYFDPSDSKIESLALPKKTILFTGAMDYWANVNAVIWFVEKVWSKILESDPDVYFYIVGSNPAKEILSLHQRDNIVVTGRVEDVRPYLQQTSLSIAPLQIARGIQNKVLEALSMGTPLVLSSMAAEGIKTSSHDNYCVVDDPIEMSRQIQLQLSQVSNTRQIVNENREFVIAHFSWESEMQKLLELVEQGRQKQ